MLLNTIEAKRKTTMNPQKRNTIEAYVRLSLSVENYFDIFVWLARIPPLARHAALAALTALTAVEYVTSRRRRWLRAHDVTTWRAEPEDTA